MFSSVVPVSSKKILDAVAANVGLESVELYGLELNPVGSLAVARCIETNPTLQELILYGPSRVLSWETTSSQVCLSTTAPSGRTALTTAYRKGTSTARTLNVSDCPTHDGDAVSLMTKWRPDESLMTVLRDSQRDLQ